MITEAEAKKKWCHMARVTYGGISDEGRRHIIMNRDVSEFTATNIMEKDTCKCLASACMAWRWFDDLTDDGTACNHKPSAKAARVPEPPPAMGRPLDERRGYCGLAGSP